MHQRVRSLDADRRKTPIFLRLRGDEKSAKELRVYGVQDSAHGQRNKSDLKNPGMTESGFLAFESSEESYLSLPLFFTSVLCWSNICPKIENRKPLDQGALPGLHVISPLYHGSRRCWIPEQVYW